MPSRTKPQWRRRNRPHARVAIMKSTARRAGRVLFSGAGRRDIAINTANMRKEYLMNDTDLKWNRKRARYEKMLADYIDKGGVVSRLPNTLERREHCPTFSFVFGPDILRRPGIEVKIEECRNAPKPAKNG